MRVLVGLRPSVLTTHSVLDQVCATGRVDVVNDLSFRLPNEWILDLEILLEQYSQQRFKLRERSRVSRVRCLAANGFVSVYELAVDEDAQKNEPA